MWPDCDDQNRPSVAKLQHMCYNNFLYYIKIENCKHMGIYYSLIVRGERYGWFFNGDLYVSYKGSKYVSDKRYWCFGQIGAWSNHICEDSESKGTKLRV